MFLIYFYRLFRVDKDGYIYVEGTGPDDLPLDEYTLLVTASDGGSPSLETSVPVYVNFEPKLGMVWTTFFHTF